MKKLILMLGLLTAGFIAQELCKRSTTEQKSEIYSSANSVDSTKVSSQQTLISK